MLSYMKDYPEFITLSDEEILRLTRLMQQVKSFNIPVK